MHVLHVVPTLAGSYGGPSYVVTQLARAQAASGLDVEVVATSNHFRPGEEALVRSLLGEQVTASFFRCVGPPRLDFAPRLVAALPTAVRRADVVHIHSVYTFVPAFAAWLCGRQRRPYVLRPAGTLSRDSITLRSSHLKRAAIAVYVMPAIRSASLVHATSEMESAELSGFVPSHRIAVCEHGIADEVFDVGAPPTRGLRIGFLGRLHRQKGVDILLHALAKLGDGVELLIAGQGEREYEAQLKQLASDLRLERRVEWLGHLDGPRKLAFLAECNVLAFPSLGESFGVAVAEALAAARPVVISEMIGIAASIARAGAGVVVPRRADDFATALRLLLDDPMLSCAQGRAGRELARTRWTWERATANVSRLYERAIQRC